MDLPGSAIVIGGSSRQTTSDELGWPFVRRWEPSAIEEGVYVSTSTPSTCEPAEIDPAVHRSSPRFGSLRTMAIYPIRRFPDPVLAMAGATITDFGEDLARLADDMLTTMYDAPGVGLAAPQIGISKRLFVADIGDGPFVMVNPKIVETAGKWKFEEGCLSVPGRYWHIKRSDFAAAEGQDLQGDPVRYEGDELMGRVLQHEIDHLNGILLLERLPNRTRKAALAELRQESLGPAGF